MMCLQNKVKGLQFLILAGFLKTLPPTGPLAFNIVFFRPKTFSKVAIIKTKNVTIAFFSSPPFFLLALSFFFFPFLRYCDFGAYRAQKACILTPFHSND